MTSTSTSTSTSESGRRERADDRSAAQTGGPAPGPTRRPVTSKPAAKLCSACDVELVSIHMTVDGNELVMESCQRCDERRWHLAGEQIDLERALAEVGEHAGRRR